MSKYHDRQAAIELQHQSHAEEATQQVNQQQLFQRKTWQQAMERMDKQHHRRQMIDNIVTAVIMAVALTAPVWAGPIAALLRKAGWL